MMECIHEINAGIYFDLSREADMTCGLCGVVLEVPGDDEDADELFRVKQ